MNWLFEPVPRWQALAAIFVSNVGMMAALLERQAALKNAAEVYADQQQRITILVETTNFLVERADDATAVELNSKLDYWRVIRGISTES